MRVTFNVVVPVRVKKEGRYFISSCPALKVSSQATTEKKAKSNLIEAVSLFLVSCYERGTLDQVLKECGFVPAHDKKSKKRRREPQGETITVPLPFDAPAIPPELCPA